MGQPMRLKGSELPNPDGKAGSTETSFQLAGRMCRVGRQRTCSGLSDAMTSDSPPQAFAADDESWLPPSEEHRSILADFREIWRELAAARGLALEFVLRDVRVRYKQTAMGFLWAVLTPTLIVISGALVRAAMAYVGGRELAASELAGMALKALPWSFFVGSLGFATVSLTSNASLVTKIYFPREVLPLASTIAHAFDACIGGAVLLVACLAFGVTFGVGALWVPPLALCMLLLTAGAALMASCANLFLRDVKYIVQVFITFGIFFTPVLFEPEMFGSVGARLMMLNPIAPILEGIRLAAIENHNLAEPLIVTGRHAVAILVWSPWYLVYSAVWAAAAFVIGLVVFHRAEAKFAEYV
jgi:lipopolysaccharide transport system permease protein